jgi:hypothetical protein
MKSVNGCKRSRSQVIKLTGSNEGVYIPLTSPYIQGGFTSAVFQKNTSGTYNAIYKPPRRLYTIMRETFKYSLVRDY